MLLQIISPAKHLDFSAMQAHIKPTSIRAESKTDTLIDIMQSLSVVQLQQILSVSPKLAELNYSRFQTIREQTHTHAKPAIYAYNGDVYEGIDVHTLPADAVNRMQDSLRIVSGLYGLLRPFDAIMPYRLEMATKMPVHTYKNLYDFWTETITQTLLDDINEGGHTHIINLASHEYFKAIDSKKITIPIIECQFKDMKNGDYKIISFYAKKARGLMARFIAKHAITEIEHLQAFDYGGYGFNAQLSSDSVFVFTR